MLWVFNRYYSRMNKMIKPPTVLYVLAFIASPFCSKGDCFQFPSEKANSVEVKLAELSALVSLEKQEGFSFSSVEVSTVAAGQACRVDLTIVNQRDTPVPLQQVKTSCGCASVTFPVAVILPGERVTGEVLVRLPASTPTGVFTVGIQFSNQGSFEPTAHISLGFPLSGSLSLESYVGTFEVCNPIETWRIPVRFTAPITEQSLVIQKSEALRDVQVKLVTSDDQYFLEFSVAEDLVSDSGLFGTFRVSDSRVGAVEAI